MHVATRNMPRELGQYASKLLGASLANSTWSSYQRAWVKFQLFARTTWGREASIPVSLDVVLSFVAFLHRQGQSASTILSTLSAISFMHKLQGCSDPTKHWLVSKMVAGARNMNPSSDLRLPITLSVLHKLLDTLDLVLDDQYALKLVRAMFLLAFHCFFRIGEIAPAVKSFKGRVLQHQHVQLVQGKEVVVSLVQFKHSGAQGPQSFRLQAQPGSKYCPVRAVSKYIKLRPDKHGPFFIHRGGSVFLRREFDQVLKDALSCCGLSCKFYKGHSFRIGAATEAAASGCSDAQIRNLGRWSSDAFKKYIRLSPQQWQGK